MSTHAYLISKPTDEKQPIRGIYVHFDDYLDYMKPRLLQHYNTSEKVDELMNLGDLSILDDNIGAKIDFEDYQTRQDNHQCLAYHRDRNENLNIEEYPNTQKTIEELSDREEFVYMFDHATQTWTWSYGTEWIPLEDL